MTVGELINKLQKFDSDKLVSIYETNSEGWLDLKSVSKDKETDTIELTVEDHTHDEKSFTVKDLKQILSNYSDDKKVGFFDISSGNLSFAAEIDKNKKNLIFNIY